MNAKRLRFLPFVLRLTQDERTSVIAKLGVNSRGVAISINRKAVILRTTQKNEGSHSLFQYYQRVDKNKGYATLRWDSSLHSE